MEVWQIQLQLSQKELLKGPHSSGLQNFVFMIENTKKRFGY